MRTKLKAIGKETRNRYHATVGRMGIKSNEFKGFPERTILLKNVVNVDTGEVVTDHLWFTVDKTTDYKLNYMTKIEVKSLDRELKAGEITSDTEPSFEELWKARKNVQTIISSRVVRATQP